MYIVLLSGGSGKRLWPLSNDLRSKQYIKVISNEKNTRTCSMLQRVWEQLEDAGLAEKSVITASQGQVDIIQSQLNDQIKIVIEPFRRDTFPAVALSCTYIHDCLNAGDDECVSFIPVDPYTDYRYFETLKKLEEVQHKTRADIVLMGVVPEAPSGKYGYIIPDQVSGKSFYPVKYFKEKPSLEEAAQLITGGALWNCGVFCVRIQYILDILRQSQMPDTYRDMYQNYLNMPKVSFDYKVLEHARNLYVVPFHGLWKDLGTWETLSAEMKENVLGNCIEDQSCKNTHVINELDIPIVTMGTDNLMIVSSFDGILVANKGETENLKKVMEGHELPPNYEERQWGVLKTLDLSQTSDGFTLLRKIVMFGNHSSSYHWHNERDEVLTILSGHGEIIIEGVNILLNQGTTITIPRHKNHAVRAFGDMEYLETHIGKTFGNEDINRITFNWDEIQNYDRSK